MTRLWQACYIVNDTVKELWQAVEDRCKDYILHPKGNNYQSLHTTVEARAPCLPPKFPECTYILAVACVLSSIPAAVRL